MLISNENAMDTLLVFSVGTDNATRLKPVMGWRAARSCARVMECGMKCRNRVWRCLALQYSCDDSGSWLSSWD